MGQETNRVNQKKSRQNKQTGRGNNEKESRVEELCGSYRGQGSAGESALEEVCFEGLNNGRVGG